MSDDASESEVESEEEEEEDAQAAQDDPPPSTEQHPSNEVLSMMDEMIRSLSDLKVREGSEMDKLQAFYEVVDKTHVKIKEKIESDSTDVQPSSSQLSWCFSAHGKYIKLGNERTTACRPERVLKSIVISEMPMVIGTRYKVKVKSMGKKCYENMAVGVTWKDPMEIGDDVIKNIKWASELTDSLIINVSGIVRQQENTNSDYGRALGSIDIGSTIEIEIDNQNCLRLYVNEVEGEDDKEDVLLKVNNFPCWAVFDVRGRCNKIRIVP